MASPRFRLFNIVQWSQSARQRTSSSSSSSSTTSSPTTSNANTTSTSTTAANNNKNKNNNLNNRKKARKSNSFRFRPHNEATPTRISEDDNTTTNNNECNDNDNDNDNDAQPVRKNAMSITNSTINININLSTEQQGYDSFSTSNRQRSSTYPSRTRPSSSSYLSSSSSHANSNNNSNSNSNTKPKPTRRRSPSPPPKIRTRLNSREIPRTYSGLYGIGGGHELTHQTQTPASDLLPFELSRNYNTNWLYSYPSADLHHNNTNYLRNNIMSSSLLWIYIFFIVFVQFALLVLPIPILKHHVDLSFTITNIVHGVITIIFLHWLKGSPNFYDYGELNALTLWEQLSCSPESNLLANQTKQVLYVIPTILCYVGCRMADFELCVSIVNLSVWGVCIVAKMEGMHGVRLFGLNRTIGIDDDVRKRKSK